MGDIYNIIKINSDRARTKGKMECFLDPQGGMLANDDIYNMITKLCDTDVALGFIMCGFKEAEDGAHEALDMQMEGKCLFGCFVVCVLRVKGKENDSPCNGLYNIDIVRWCDDSCTCQNCSDADSPICNRQNAGVFVDVSVWRQIIDIKDTLAKELNSKIMTEGAVTFSRFL